MKWPITILHLGLGRFHRAHQAVYYQKLFNQENIALGVAAFSMRSSHASDELRSVNHHYPVIEVAKQESNIHWIDAISQSFFVHRDFEKLMDFFISPFITLVTLTITEKGYLVNEDPMSAMSLLFLGLKKRKELLGLPITVLSCDNLFNNGNILKNIMLDYALSSKDEEMYTWIKKEVSFPNSMVDRIVPALTPEKIYALQKQFNFDTTFLLATEFFSQWVIEDHFNITRPPIEKVGVQFVKDVRPFEEMKLRLLNASHSLIAYSGIAKKYFYVHQAIQDPQIQSEVLGLHDEVIPLLNVPDNMDLRKYSQSLIERFNNPMLPHQLHQIAMDGSQKIPQRIFPSLKIAFQKKMPTNYLNAVIEYWIKYCYEHIPDDPLREKLLYLKKESLNFSQFRKNVLEIFYRQIYS
jgi:fructuronate reductase